jgi:ribonuclease R
LPADHVKFESVLRAMARLRDQLHEARHARGAIYLDLPKLRLTLDDSMEVAELARDARDPSHTLIEEFMLAANEAVAGYLVDKRLPLVARVHPPPEERKLKEFRSFIAALGVRPGGNDATVLRAVQRGDSGYFQRLIAKVAEDPLSPVIQLAMLRTMGHAEYVLGPGLHFALATTRYCHFTSPIRRYPDLLVHQVLDEHFDGTLAKATRRREWDTRLSHSAEHASELERRAEEAEREMVQLRLLRYLKPRLGEEMDARVVSVHPFGFFVRNEETLVEGLVHVSSLDDDFYEHDREGHSLRGRRHRRRFAVADRVRVQLADVDFDRRSVSFRFVRKIKAS